ncbi:unnamed protein product [Nezara viridula]|uniref:Uncharacterized protein n=1 Tax=Nezara viridula TaxID=85310 RepID=A0A9P0GUV5_NEZVI|nr:unnamed protein product [Nezara viridula]
MATVRRICPLRSSGNGLFRLFRRNHHDAPTYLRARRAKKATAVLAVGGIALYSFLKLNHFDNTVHAFKKAIKVSQ